MFTTDTILSMEAAAENGADGLLTIIDAHRSRLGIDDYRNYYILDGQGRFLNRSNPNITLTTDKQYHLGYGREAGMRSLCVGQYDGCRPVPVDMDRNDGGADLYCVHCR